jgi:hypothetical protein
VFPRRKIHVGKVYFDLAADLVVIRNREIVFLGIEINQAIGPVGDAGSVARSLE